MQYGVRKKRLPVRINSSRAGKTGQRLFTSLEYQEESMNRNLKIALIILAVVLILCLCLCAGGLITFRLLGRSMSNMVSLDPTQASQVASQIAEFDTPPGFEQGSMEFFGFQAVFLHGTGRQVDTTIIMMQFPQSMAFGEEQMRQQVETFANQQASPLGLNLAVVGDTDVDIMGQTAHFSILEGVVNDGTAYRQWAGLFEGKGGPTFLTITAPLDDWDQTLIDSFLASIR